MTQGGEADTESIFASFFLLKNIYMYIQSWKINISIALFFCLSTFNSSLDWISISKYSNNLVSF